MRLREVDPDGKDSDSAVHKVMSQIVKGCQMPAQELVDVDAINNGNSVCQTNQNYPRN
jgi:hypothetical protein